MYLKKMHDLLCMNGRNLDKASRTVIFNEANQKGLSL